MDHRQEAERRISACDRAGTAAVDVLERIDDALRNTVGGRP